MKAFKIALTAFGTAAVLLVLTVTPARVSFASTTFPSTRVASEAPITAGASRSECLTPDLVDTGLAALQNAVTGFDALTDSTVTCLSAYLNSATAWADWEDPWITDPTYGYTSWVADAPQSRQLVLAVDLIPLSLEDESDPLGWEQSCAAGDFDSYATELGANLVAAGLENSVIRLGAEMNGTWESDFMGTTTQEQNLWATCFANEVTAMRQAPGENFLIDWDTNACKGPYPYANYYPGNAYVDIVGLDLYDVDCTTPNTSVNFSQLSSETYGLTDFEEFAAAQGKPMSFPEWGLSTVPSGDDPAYIIGMASTVANQDFAFETYFDGAGGTNSKAMALGPSTSLSLTAYQDWFGPPTTISGVVTAVGGGDLAGICAEAFLLGTEVGVSSTASDGTYTISGLAPGSYYTEFFAGTCGGGNYATQWYNSTLSGTPIFADALGVSTSVASPASDINAKMTPGANIAGAVTAVVGGSDVAGVCVSVNSTDGGIDSSATTAANGTYSVSELAAGSYDVNVDPTCGGTVTTPYASPQPTSAAVMVTAGETSTYNVGLVVPGSIVDVITPSTSAPTNAVVGGATYSPSATAASGDNVAMTLDGGSTGCALNAGVVNFTAVGTCIIDFNDSSSGPSDAYASAVQVQQTFNVAASPGGGGGSPPSPPVTTTPISPVATPPTVTPPTTSASIPTPREVTYTRNSRVLSFRAREVLSALVKRLSPGSFVTVIGYAHDDKTLARGRANAVSNFLVQQVSVHVTVKVIITSSANKVMVITTKL